MTESIQEDERVDEYAYIVWQMPNISRKRGSGMEFSGVHSNILDYMFDDDGGGDDAKRYFSFKCMKNYDLFIFLQCV